jgi:ligand-binding SRPBCC domain-containing protein
MILKLETIINAPIEVVFDAARNLDLHQKANKKSSERIIDGRKHGLIELGDIITWEARHFGVKQKLRVEEVKLKAPYLFEDKMLQGAFKYLFHSHQFEALNFGTKMIDVFEFKSPVGVLGSIIDYLVLGKYMARFLTAKNQFLKHQIENQIL